MRMIWSFWLLLAVVVTVAGFAGWVRMAPSDPARWHGPITAAEDRDMPGGVIRVLKGRAGDIGRLDEIIRATPRTSVLAGTVGDGRVTYVTRSKLWGFPDYTTIEAKADDLLIHARLRFGQSDMGVNRARVQDWLSRLRQD